MCTEENNNQILMEMLRTKSIESLQDKNKSENNENPNPYIRRFGSHIKSHFSRSRCEIFDSADEDKGSLHNQAGTQMNSLHSMGSMRADFSQPGEGNKSSLQNLDSLRRKERVKHSSYRMGSSTHIKNSPSIDRGSEHSRPGQLDLEQEAPDASQFKLDLESPENECQGKLIITRSRKSSLDSVPSVDSDTANLIEPGTELIMEIRKENFNRVPGGNEHLDKRNDLSQNSTANNSMFRSGGEKIDEEEQDQEGQDGQLDIES